MQVDEIKQRIRKLQKGNYIPLYKDLQWKYIFGTSENIKNTIMLLELVYKQKGKFDELKLEHEVKLTREAVNSKSFELDTVASLPNGEIYNLEMQSYLDKEAEIKNTLYVSKLFGGIVKRGEKYNEARKVSQLEFIKENKQHKTKDIINVYHLTNDKDMEDKILEDLFEIITVDIEKTEDKEYNKGVDEELERFIKVIKASTLESAIEAAEDNLQLLEVLESLVRFDNNEYVQDYAREQALIDTRYEVGTEKAREEGRTEGITIGEKSKAIEIAKIMINNNESIEKIMIYTGLSKEEIEKIIKDIKN